MERTDDKGRQAGAEASAGAKSPALRADKASNGVFRERMRAANAAVAAKRISTLPPPPAPAGHSASSPPEHSGVRSMPTEREPSQRVVTASLFEPPTQALRPPPLPREVAAPPASATAKVAVKVTQPGLGGAQPTAATPSAVAPAADITTARTQPLPRVVVRHAEAVSTAAPSSASSREASAQRGAGSPSKPPIPGLLRASQAPASNHGRYSMRDVPMEYVEAHVQGQAARAAAARREAAVAKGTAPKPSAPTVQAPAAQPSSSEAALPRIMVDPQLGAVANERASQTAKAERYTPLPGDRESFESFMRERMKGSANARPDWSEHETKLISRESLGAGNAGLRGARWAGLGLVGAVLLGIAAWLVSHRAQPLATVSTEHAAAPAAPAQPTAAKSSVVLMTEPAGAEIVVGGAVVGNTPSQVQHGGGDDLYLLRLAGFEPQLVRITAQTRGSVRVTLKPLDAP